MQDINQNAMETSKSTEGNENECHIIMWRQGKEQYKSKQRWTYIRKPFLAIAAETLRLIAVKK